MDRLWRLKHWLRYQPSIAFYSIMAKVFRFLAHMSDKIGAVIFGQERWQEIKIREGIEKGEPMKATLTLSVHDTATYQRLMKVLKTFPQVCVNEKRE